MVTVQERERALRDRQLGAQMRRALNRHGAAHVDVGGVDLAPGKQIEPPEPAEAAMV